MNWINGLIGTAATGGAAILASRSISLNDVREVAAVAGVFIGLCVGVFTLWNAYLDNRHKRRRDRFEKEADSIDDLHG